MSALKKVEELLQCPVCLEAYTEPKILQCFHIFCQKCIIPLVIQGRQGRSNSVRCPACREVTLVPESGVVELRSAGYVDYLKDVFVLLSVAVEKAHCCPVHDGMKLELFCETCNELICLKCAYKDGGNHSSHDNLYLETAFLAFRETFIPKLDSTRNRLLQTLRRVSEAACIPATLGGSHLGSDPVDHEAIAYRQSLLETVTAELKEVEKALNAALFKLKKKKSAKVVQHKREIVSRLSDIEAKIELNRLKLEAPDPSQCKVTGLSERTVTGKIASFQLSLVDFCGKKCSNEALNSLECNLVSAGVEDSVTCIVERGDQGHSYDISYRPLKEGLHHLHLQLSGRHILGSPFSVYAESAKVDSAYTETTNLDSAYAESAKQVERQKREIDSRRKGRDIKNTDIICCWIVVLLVLGSFPAINVLGPAYLLFVAIRRTL